MTDAKLLRFLFMFDTPAHCISHELWIEAVSAAQAYEALKQLHPSAYNITLVRGEH